MPEEEIKARGGAKRWRTISLPGGRKYIHVAVVGKAGERGGHTVGGEVHTKQKMADQLAEIKKRRKK